MMTALMTMVLMMMEVSGYTDDGYIDGYTDDGILDDGSINNIDDGANMDGIDGSVEEAAPQDEFAPDSDSEVVQ